jgi:large subunit ribosomal protein L10
MAKTKKEKQALLDAYSKKIKASKGFIVLKPNKLTPNEANDFRKEIYDFNSSWNVVKNTIFKMALKENNLPEIESLNNGEHAVLFFNEDMVTPAKALKKFVDNTKTKEGDFKVEIVNGILEGTILSASQVAELSDMPDVRGSVALILGILDNAMSGIVNVLEDAPRAYVYVLDQAFK